MWQKTRFDFMDKRYTAARIELLQEKLDQRETAAARIRDRLTDPARAALGDHKKSFDPRRREIMLTESIDRISAIEQSADRLRHELDELRDEVMQELESVNDYYTRKCVVWRLVRGYTWSECAELSGYNERTLENKYYKWLDS